MKRSRKVRGIYDSSDYASAQCNFRAEIVSFGLDKHFWREALSVLLTRSEISRSAGKL